MLKIELFVVACALTVQASFGQVYSGERIDLSKGAANFRGSALPGFLAPRAANLVPDTTYSIGPAWAKAALTVTIRYSVGALATGMVESRLRMFQVIGHEWVLINNSKVDLTTKTVTATVASTGTFGIESGSSIPFENAVYYRPFANGDSTLYRGVVGQEDSEPVSNMLGLPGVFTKGTEILPTRNGLVSARVNAYGSIDLYVTDIDGSNARNIAGPYLAVSQSVFSDDGTVIYFIGKTTNFMGLVRLNLLNGAITRTGANIKNFGQAGPAYMHGLVAYFDDKTIWRQAGQTNTGFTSIGVNPVQSVDISPDEKMILWSTEASPTLGSQVYVANIDGTNQTLLGFGSYPKWSPDGTKLVFQTDGGIGCAVLNDVLGGSWFTYWVLQGAVTYRPGNTNRPRLLFWK
jgi:hypothetical protein